jgi:hypothetical protein
MRLQDEAHAAATAFWALMVSGWGAPRIRTRCSASLLQALFKQAVHCLGANRTALAKLLKSGPSSRTATAKVATEPASPGPRIRTASTGRIA